MFQLQTFNTQPACFTACGGHKPFPMYLELSPQAAVHTPGCPCTVASSRHPVAGASHNTQNIHPQVLSQAKDKSPPLAAQHSLFLAPLQARVPHTGRHPNPPCHPLVAAPFPAHTLKSHHTVRATHPAPLSRTAAVAPTTHWWATKQSTSNRAKHHTLTLQFGRRKQHPANSEDMYAAACSGGTRGGACTQSRGLHLTPSCQGLFHPPPAGPLPAAAAGPACQTPQMSPGDPGADLGLSCLCEALNSTCAAGWLHSCLGVWLYVSAAWRSKQAQAFDDTPLAAAVCPLPAAGQQHVWLPVPSTPAVALYTRNNGGATLRLQRPGGRSAPAVTQSDPRGDGTRAMPARTLARCWPGWWWW